MPLAVFTDLVGRGVPVQTATSIVIQLSRSGVKDQDLATFQRNVRADIDRGADPIRRRHHTRTRPRAPLERSAQ